MKEKIKLGYIGLGRRGRVLLRGHFSKMKDVEVVALCDLSDERMQKGREYVVNNGGKEPILTKNYKDIINDPEIDAVAIMIGWSGRPQIAMEAMRAGKYTAIEVGCADTLKECYDLVRTYEETGTPLMMLENCCYGRREMMVLNMVKQGLFGEVVHCTGGYHHYLQEEDLFKNIETNEIPHYRLAHYREQNRESYPTHELGPIAKVLNIFSKLPVIKQFNRLGGALLGGIKGILILYIMIAIVTVFVPFEENGVIVQGIEESSFAGAMYEDNIILNLIGKGESEN